MDKSKRDLLKLAGTGAAVAVAGVMPSLAGLDRPALAGTLKRVVVIGGGFGGSSVAKYLKLWGQGQVQITHVDVNASYASPILSNLVLNGQKTIANMSFSLATAASRNGNTFVQGKATLNRGLKTVSVVRSGKPTVTLAYDKVIVSPGVEFDYLPSVAAINGSLSDSSVPIPHAWKSGAQVTNLKSQIDRMPSKTGVFVLCIPKKPFRCPPGPYERACVVADILKRVKGGGKVIVFDANVPDPLTPDDKYSAIQAERHTFETAFTGQFSGIVEYVSNAELIGVENSGGQYGTKTAIVNIGGAIRRQICNVLNVIPKHKAGDIVFNAGLIPSGLFVPVDLMSYASSVDPNIHVIGDAHLSSQPKAGHVANSEAKICADAIVRQFGILPPHLPAEVPVTNSACYSPITNSTASWLTAGYRYNPTTRAMDRIPESYDEAESPSGDNYKMMLAWANNLFADTFSV